MSLLVVGTVALDDIETPTHKRADVLGGSATFFSYVASLFADVHLVASVGEDWPGEHTELLKDRGVNIDGLEVVSGGRTFRWKGRYHENMNDRDTMETHLNVLETFNPALPEAARNCRHVFLANIDPRVQMRVLDQVHNPELVVADTMDLWINILHDELLTLLKRLDGIVLNDSEARLLTGEENLVTAGQRVLELGPRFVVVKKGEHGAMFFGEEGTYVLPAFPTSRVVDPTGAGDSFAGGMMGYLAAQEHKSPATLKRAIAQGIVAASFTVEDFSLDRFRDLDRAEIDRRLDAYQQMLVF